MTRKTRQPSRGKASQPYRFAAWGPRVGGEDSEREGEEKVKSWYKVQERERWTARVRQQHAPVCPAAARQRSSSRRTVTRVDLTLGMTDPTKLRNAQSKGRPVLRKGKGRTNARRCRLRADVEEAQGVVAVSREGR